MQFGSQELGLGLMIQIWQVPSECGPSNLVVLDLRRRQIITIFDPFPLRRQFFTTICRQIWSILTPPPKKCRRLKWMVP